MRSGIVLFCLIFGLSAHADLKSYVNKPEPVGGWTFVKKEGYGLFNSPVTIHQLEVTSLDWHGVTWKHRVDIYYPMTVNHPNTAMVYALPQNFFFDNWIGEYLANKLKAPVVFIHDIPNQPLNGMTENKLMAYTFKKYLETNDEEWLLLFPMTKAIVKVMDAVKEYTTQAREFRYKHQTIENYVLGGESKRGWAVWLAPLVDKRILGIAPAVFEGILLPRQLYRQITQWGALSPLVSDFVDFGLFDLIATDAGQKLMELIDPYYHLNELTLPKMITSATNDPFWATDSVNLYWNELKGPKYLTYSINTGHGMLTDRKTYYRAVVAFFHSIVDGWKMPEISYSQIRKGNTIQMRAFTVFDAGLTKKAKIYILRKDGDFDIMAEPVRWLGGYSLFEGFKLNWDKVAGNGIVSDTLELSRAENIASFLQFEYRGPHGNTFKLATPMLMNGHREIYDFGGQRKFEFTSSDIQFGKVTETPFPVESLRVPNLKCKSTPGPHRSTRRICKETN